MGMLDRPKPITKIKNKKTNKIKQTFSVSNAQSLRK